VHDTPRVLTRQHEAGRRARPLFCPPTPHPSRSMATLTGPQAGAAAHGSIGDPFLSHLVALLSVYEVGPQVAAPVPTWTGPSAWYQDTILRAITSLARRAYTAEDALAAHKASVDWETAGPDTKKRRSVGLDELGHSAGDSSSSSGSVSGSPPP
jgi:hypothetical protein